MICAACGQDNRAGAKFCGSCGSSLGLACPSCGTPITKDERFCTECGTALTTAPEARAQAHHRPVRRCGRVDGSAGAVGRQGVGADHVPLHRRPRRGGAEVRRDGRQFTGDGIMALFGAPSGAGGPRPAGRLPIFGFTDVGSLRYNSTPRAFALDVPLHGSGPIALGG